MLLEKRSSSRDAKKSQAKENEISVPTPTSSRFAPPSRIFFKFVELAEAQNAKFAGADEDCVVLKWKKKTIFIGPLPGASDTLCRTHAHVCHTCRFYGESIAIIFFERTTKKVPEDVTDSDVLRD